MLSLKSVVYCTVKAHLKLDQMHLKSSKSLCEQCYCIWQPRVYNINKDFHGFKGVNVIFIIERMFLIGVIVWVPPVADPKISSLSAGSIKGVGEWGRAGSQSRGRHELVTSVGSWDSVPLRRLWEMGLNGLGPVPQRVRGTGVTS